MYRLVNKGSLVMFGWDWVGWSRGSLGVEQRPIYCISGAWCMNFSIEFNTIRKNIHQSCHIKLTDYSEVG